jgi:hypothetical protein
VNQLQLFSQTSFAKSKKITFHQWNTERTISDNYWRTSRKNCSKCCADALKTHFLVGQSYALSWCFASGLSVSTMKTICYVCPKGVQVYRDLYYQVFSSIFRHL